MMLFSSKAAKSLTDKARTIGLTAFRKQVLMRIKESAKEGNYQLILNETQQLSKEDCEFFEKLGYKVTNTTKIYSPYIIIKYGVIDWGN